MKEGQRIEPARHTKETHIDPIGTAPGLSLMCLYCPKVFTSLHVTGLWTICMGCCADRGIDPASTADIQRALDRDRVTPRRKR